MISIDSLSFSRGFGSDNHSGVHPEIFAAMAQVNQDHSHAYGLDSVSDATRALFKKTFGAEIETYFVFNGTAANVLSLRGLLESYNSVLCGDSSHLAVDECAAPEMNLGCKLIPVKTEHGKVSISSLEPHLIRFGDQHAAQPKVVSITQPTEVGTVYSLQELRDLREFTRKHKLLLHIDGARLANAACHLNCDFKALTTDIGIDALSFGGTKNGLLGAEAVIFWASKADTFRFRQKQSMQLPSKVRFISAQFLTYLQNDLWLRTAQHVNGMAKRLEAELRKIPEIEIVHPVQSNAVFARIPKAWTKHLKETCFFYVWDESEWIVRLMMGFDAKPSDIDRFMMAIGECRRLFPVERQ